MTIPSGVGRQHLPDSLQREPSKVEFENSGPGSHLPDSLQRRFDETATEQTYQNSTPKSKTSDAAQQTASDIADFLESAGKDNPELSDWVNSVDVDVEGYVIHDVDIDRPSQQQLWGEFTKFSKDVLGGQSFLATASNLHEGRNKMALADLNAASQIQEEVGLMRSEYEGFMAAVRTKDPEAVERAFNTPEDKQVIAGLLKVTAFELMNNPEADVEELTAASETLMKIYKGEEVSEEELVKLEPNLESMSHKLFPHSVSNDYVADLIKGAQEKLNKNPDLFRRTMS